MLRTWRCTQLIARSNLHKPVHVWWNFPFPFFFLSPCAPVISGNILVFMFPNREVSHGDRVWLGLCLMGHLKGPRSIPPTNGGYSCTLPTWPDVPQPIHLNLQIIVLGQLLCSLSWILSFRMLMSAFLFVSFVVREIKACEFYPSLSLSSGMVISRMMWTSVFQ